MVEVIPESYVAQLDLPKIFGRIAPLDVDLGCSDGAFLIALAERSPERNFLGIEREASRVDKACRKAGPERTGGRIDNVRILHLETSYAVRYLLPEQSVETFYLLFPDPWPKRRHRGRRVMSPDFLESIHRAMAANGILQIATDQRDYFQQMQRYAQDDPRFELITGQKEGALPTTKFERIFLEQGLPIYRLGLRKVSPVI
ncbi:MAG: tRNA (guanosine(46)-N7)-methyltransferase TrmB [Verrucomicrobiota bacterium]